MTRARLLQGTYGGRALKSTPRPKSAKALTSERGRVTPLFATCYTASAGGTSYNMHYVNLRNLLPCMVMLIVGIIWG